MTEVTANFPRKNFRLLKIQFSWYNFFTRKIWFKINKNETAKTKSSKPFKY